MAEHRTCHACAHQTSRKRIRCFIAQCNRQVQTGWSEKAHDGCFRYKFVQCCVRFPNRIHAASSAAVITENFESGEKPGVSRVIAGYAIKGDPSFDRFYLSPAEVRFGSWYSTRSRPGMSSKPRRFRVRKR